MIRSNFRKGFSLTNNIDKLLSQKTWAVVGVSSDKTKYGYKVFARLKNSGYSVYAVNPKLGNIDGEICYPSLTSLPEKPDAVSLVVPPDVTEQTVKECQELGITKIWMQPGSESSKAIHNADVYGITAIHNQCVLIHTQERDNKRF